MNDTMKIIRVVLMSFLLVASACFLSGCATTSQNTYKPVAGMDGIEKKQPSPAEYGTPSQTCANMLLDFLFSWGVASIH